MSSNLKVNNILPSTGDTVAVSGIASVTSSVSIASSCTATTFYGSGANLTGITALSGSTNNTIVTVTGANAIQGEANLTFDGTQLSVTGSATPPVYIGGANPGIKFEDTNASGTPLSYIYASDGQISIRADDGDETGSSLIDFRTDGTEKLRITSGGQINIGGDYTQTSYNLSVTNSGGNLFRIKTSNEGDYDLRFMIQNNESNMWHYGTDDFVFGNRYDRKLHFITNGSKRLTIHGDFVGINNTAPAYPLEVIGDGGGAFAAATNSTHGQLSIVGKNSSGGISAISRIKSYPDGSSNQSHMAFETRNSSSQMLERLRITSTGQALLSGLTTNNDPRSTQGLTIKSTSGLSFQNYGSNGSRNWRIRPDDMSRWGDLDFSVSPTANSATDWPDAAADKVLTLGYDGAVLKPRNPCFQAVVNGSHVSGGSYVVFGAIDVNNGNHYNNSNGIFTAPVAGVYLFHISSIAFNNASTVFRFYLRINNGNTGSGNDAHLRIDMNNDDADFGPNASYTYYKAMNANDTARVYFSPDDNSANAYGGSDYFKFGGHLVG